MADRLTTLRNLLLCSLLLAACGPAQQNGTDSGSPDAGTDAGFDAGVHDAGSGDAGPTLSAIQAAIFTPTCAAGACHNPMFAEPNNGGLDLSVGDAYANLVGDAGLGVPVTLPGVNMLRVDPGHPESSFIMIKIATLWTNPNDDDGGYGYPMPYNPTGVHLSAAQVQLISDWISAGAPNN